MDIEPHGVHYRILMCLFRMPRPVRGMSDVMLNKEFNAPTAVAELSAAGLIRSRGWDSLSGKVPESIWDLTPEGEALCRRFTGLESGGGI